MSAGLRIENLSTGYGKRKIIRNLSVASLPQGKITVLLGPNGSGKSTLLRALAGLNPACGALWLDNESLMPHSFSQRAGSVVYLPQSLPAGVHLSVLESVIVAQRAAGWDKNGSDHTDIVHLLAQLGIGHLAMSPLEALSGGQKQRVGLAQSLIRQPRLLLLDEPLSALDLKYQFQVMALVKRETASRKMVTVVVVHDINTALRHGDYILMLKQGELIADGTPAQVITPAHLASVYGVEARIESCSKGMPHVLIDGLVAGEGSFMGGCAKM